MAKLNITIEIANYIKNVRLKYKKPTLKLAKEINKSPAYISKLEKGDIKSIDFDLILSMFENITNLAENKAEAYTTLTDDFLSKFTIDFSEEEIKSQESLMNFDTVIRKIPFENDIKEFVKNKLADLNLSIEDLVSIVNENRDIDVPNIQDHEKNVWFFNNGKCSIILELDLNEIKKMFDEVDYSVNYVTAQSIIYNILKLEGYNKNEAYKESIKILNSFKFYSLLERNEIIKKEQTDGEQKKLLSFFDNNNVSIVNNILQHIKALSLIDVKYANEKLKNIENNFKEDRFLTIAYTAIDITKLKPKTKDTKKEFLNRIKELVDEYSNKIEENEKEKLI